MIVVSDTSPILNLARIGRLELLPLLYSEVLIPVAVYRELSARRSELPLTLNLSGETWLTVASAKDQERVRVLQEDLDAGEAEAIVLAIERGAHLLLMDERRGRHFATVSGLDVTGLLGVLARAKKAGHLTSAKAALDELIHKAGFWISPALYAEFLALVGEA